MEPIRSLNVPVVALILALAGCAGNEPTTTGAAGGTIGSSTAPPPPAPEPTVTDETGSIAGVVVDDEQVPLGNVRITLLSDQNLTAYSDAGGQFTFNELRPGSYDAFAEKFAYESRAKKVDVAAGEVTDVRFELTALALSVPRQESFIYEGEIGIGASAPGLTLHTAASAAGYGVSHKRNAFYPLANDSVSAVTGLVWQHSAPGTAKTFNLDLYFSDKTCSKAQCVRLNGTKGGPPLITRTDDIQAAMMDKPDPHVSMEFGVAQCSAISASAVDCANDPYSAVQLAFQQKLTLYTTLFYALPAPPTFDPTPK